MRLTCGTSNTGGGVVSQDCRMRVPCGLHLRQDTVKGHKIAQKFATAAEQPRRPQTVVPLWPLLGPSILVYLQATHAHHRGWWRRCVCGGGGGMRCACCSCCWYL